MNKKTLLFTLFCFLSTSIFSQIRLDIEGEAHINGRLLVGDLNSSNTFIGEFTGRRITTGRRNTFVGNYSGQANTSGNYNAFTGMFSGQANTFGGHNTFIGYSAGYNNRSSDNNTFLGCQAGFNSRGQDNTFIGRGAGRDNNSGNNNTCVGKEANVQAGDLQNAMAIGYNASVDESNKVVIGNTSVTLIGGYANWMLLSDQRYKKNIQKEDTKHLDFILNLNPVSYQYNTVKLLKEQQLKRDELSKIHDQESDLLAAGIDLEAYEQEKRENNERAIKAAQKKDEIRYTGFLAQEVEAAANDVDYTNFSGIIKADENGGKYALKYAEFVVPLVGAVQEQQKIITQQKTAIDELRSEIDELKKALSNLTATDKKQEHQKIHIDGQMINKASSAFATLEQNMPNPFNGTTKIQYFVPVNSQSAKLQLFNLDGILIKSVDIKNFGKGAIEIQLDNVKGALYYSLIIDEQLIDTKKMTSFNK